MCVCARVRACVRACVRARVRVRVEVGVGAATQHALHHQRTLCLVSVGMPASSCQVLLSCIHLHAVCDRRLCCTLHTAPCTLHTAHCTLHTAHCRPEGPTYWGYATKYALVAIEMLKSATGDAQGLETAPGFSNTGMFRIHGTSPLNGKFNWGDSDSAGK